MQIDKKLLRRFFLIGAGFIAFAWLLLDTQRVKLMFTYLWGLFAPFAVGAIIAFIFNVPMRAIEHQLEGIRKDGLRRTLSILLTLAALFLVVFFVFELLIPQIQETVDALSAKIPAFANRVALQVTDFLGKNPEIQTWVFQQLNIESLDLAMILEKAWGILRNTVSSVMGGAFGVIGGLTTGIVNGVISLVFAVYCLSGKDTLARQGKQLAYALFPEHAADEMIRILRLTNSTFSNFISGQCLEACILGGLFAVFMAIFKMPYIPLVSVIIAVTALIPIVGAFVGCIVGTFFILVNDPIQALSFVALFLVLQQVEGNLIYPKVVGTSIGLPGMWVLAAVSVGGEVMGVAGMLVMIPLVSVLYALTKEFTQRRLAQRGISPEKLEAQPQRFQSRFQQNKERKEQLKARKMREKFKQLYEKTKK